MLSIGDVRDAPIGNVQAEQDASQLTALQDPQSKCPSRHWYHLLLALELSNESPKQMMHSKLLSTAATSSRRARALLTLPLAILADLDLNNLCLTDF